MGVAKAALEMGADVIIETSGNVHALQSALKGLAYNGTIAYVAFASAGAKGIGYADGYVQEIE